MKKAPVIMLFLLLFGAAGGIFMLLGKNDSATPAEIVRPDGCSSFQIKENRGKMAVNVFWDASCSMSGYAVLPEKNIYRNLPDCLEDIGGSMGEITFYRFGEKVTKLSGRQHRAFSNPDSHTEVITAVHKVIDEADTDKLTIIVSDLFEGDADWSNISRKIKEKYFAAHKSAAIIGIKNPFKGKLYDIGLNAATLYYDSGNNPEKYHPFYLLLLGDAEKINEFIERWQGRYGTETETMYAVFSETLIKNVVDFSNMRIGETVNFYPDETIGLPDNNCREYGINDMRKEAVFETAFEYSPYLGSCYAENGKLQARLRLFAMNEDGTWEEINGEKIKCEIKADTEKERCNIVTVKLLPEESFKAEKINFLHIEIIPEKRGLKVPRWLSLWNMTNLEVNNAFDGAKTPNILRLSESIFDAMLDAVQPTIADINLVIKTK